MGNIEYSEKKKYPIQRAVITVKIIKEKVATESTETKKKNVHCSIFTLTFQLKNSLLTLRIENCSLNIYSAAIT